MHLTLQRNKKEQNLYLLFSSLINDWNDRMISADAHKATSTSTLVQAPTAFILYID